VYCIRLAASDGTKQIAAKTAALLAACKAASTVKRNTTVAIKQHFGEEGNTTFLKPPIARVVADLISSRKAFPVMVETNTLYTGDRSDTYHHLMLAHRHGFTIENVGAPVAILDGVHGQNQRAVAVPGTHFSTVHVVTDLPFFDSMFVLSHVKGHMITGMGGAIKNLGMGLASRAGKLAQHADFRPSIDHDTCRRCGLCTTYCPAGALKLVGRRLKLNRKLCVGCGECYAACRHGAISFDWSSSGRQFQEKMAEHALGAVAEHHDRVWYLNYVCDITRQCDCWSEHNPVRYGNVAILASRDPVAADRASCDIAEEVLGKDVFREMWPELDASAQMQHGERIGLGTQTYKLLEAAQR
jgi:uncharacterized Fe-S center protein